MIKCHTCGEYYDVSEMYFVSLVEYFTYYDSVLCDTCIRQIVGLLHAGKMKFEYDFSDFVSPPSDTIKDILTNGESNPVIDTFYKIYGEIPITPEIAQRLSKTLGSTPEFWLIRENTYRNDLAYMQHCIASTALGAFWSHYSDVLEELSRADEIACPVCGGLAMWEVDDEDTCIYQCINCGWTHYIE